MGALPAGGAMVGDRGHRGRGRRVDRGQRGRALDRRDQRPDLDRHLRHRGGGRGDPQPTGRSKGTKDQAPRRLPRLPLAADGADARASSPRSPQSLDLQRAQDPDRLQPHRRAAQRRAGNRPRLLGRPRARAGALRRRGRDPRRARAPAPTWSSAPTRCSARWRASACGEDAEAAFVPTLREGRPEAEAIATALADAHAAGAKLDWDAFFKGTGAKRVAAAHLPLPARALLARRPPPARATLSAAGQSAAEHPLLGAAIEDPERRGPHPHRPPLPRHPPLAGRPRRRRHRPPARHRLRRAGAAGRRAGRRRERSRS